MSSNKNYIVVGLLVSPSSLNSLDITAGYLIVVNGKIINKGPVEDFAAVEKSGMYSNFEIVKLSDTQFVMPGLVDCHTHAPQFPNVGLGLDRPLLEWLDKYTFPLECQYGNIDFAAKVYDQVVQRLLINGTTTACYFGTIHLDGTLELAKAAIRRHQRALVGKVSMNIENGAGYYNETTTELQHVETFVKKILDMRNELVSPVVTPRFAVSCDQPLMAGLGDIARRHGVRIQTHISENRQEIELVLKMNPESTCYADVYDRSNLLNERCILAHAVHLSEDETRLLASRRVSVAHCPSSNTGLRSGLCPVRRLLDAGVSVGLGTDVSGGGSTSLLDAARRAMDVSTHLELQAEGAAGAPALRWTEALYLATLGGAKALNLDNTIGSLDVGKDFDAIVVDVFAKSGPIDVYPEVAKDTIDWRERATELVQRFLYLGDDRNIIQVYVKGKLVKCSNNTSVQHGIVL